MLSSEFFCKDIYNLLAKNNILSIAGSSGSGKTTLALQLISTFLTDIEFFQSYCLWIQASELFPKRRLEKMLEASPNKLNNVLNNILIVPSNQPCENYETQRRLIHNITENNIILPSNLKYLVIDNISHHLRYEVLRCNDVQSYVAAINDFFDTQLYPLIIFCELNNLYLILIHEITYDPGAKKNKMFSHKLYHRIRCPKIFLESNNMQKRKYITISNDKKSITYRYRLVNKGLELIQR